MSNTPREPADLLAAVRESANALAEAKDDLSAARHARDESIRRAAASPGYNLREVGKAARLNAGNVSRICKAPERTPLEKMLAGAREIVRNSRHD